MEEGEEEKLVVPGQTVVYVLFYAQRRLLTDSLIVSTTRSTSPARLYPACAWRPWVPS